MASDNPTKPHESPARPELTREERLEASRRIKAALHRASPLGRIEAHEKNVAALTEAGIDPDEAQYRRFVDDARLFYSRGETDEARVYLARADGAFAVLERIHDPDRIRGAKVKKAAKEGGSVRKGQTFEATQHRLEELARLIEAGHTIASAAAALERKQGYGTKGSLRKLWHRHTK